jgi:hypothetical protein
VAKDAQNGAKKTHAPDVHWVQGLNHFEMLETLHDEHSVHAQALADLIKRVRERSA